MASTWSNCEEQRVQLYSALRIRAGNWAPVFIVAQTEFPFLLNHRKGKIDPNPLTDCRSLEDLRKLLGKINQQVASFSPNSKTVRPIAERKSGTNPEKSQKVNTSS